MNILDALDTALSEPHRAVPERDPMDALCDLDRALGIEPRARAPAGQGDVRKDNVIPFPRLLEIHRDDPDRLPWPDDWISRRDPADAHACRKLWVSVLIFCAQGALEGRARDLRSGVGVGDAVTSSIIGTEDFQMICALAGLDGDALIGALAHCWPDPDLCEAMLERLSRAYRH